jgi:DNA-binding CsgD family transcriptional regulator
LNFKLSEAMQKTVIRLWLVGKSRNYIARTCRVAEGTVSNTISDLKLTIGNGDAEALRDYEVTLRGVELMLLNALKGIGFL